MRYAPWRATDVKDRYVLGYCDRFYNYVPHEVCTRGMWQMLDTSEVVRLKPEHRHALASDSCVYVEAHTSGFEFEAER